MKTLLALIAILLSVFSVQAQETTVNKIMKRAIELRKKGQFKEALEIHQKIYKSNPKVLANNYNYACLYGLMRNKDSCLKYLRKALHPRFGLLPLSDPDLFFLHNTPEWDSIESYIINRNKFRVQRIKDLDYAKKLYRLSAADQAFYADLQIAERRFGRNSQEVKNIWKKKSKQNEKNQLELEALLNEKGWPKRSVVGMQAARSAFLIIQHSDLDKMKKYIPTIKKLCNEGEGSCQAFALMFDRIQCSEGKPQRYGTQVRYNDDTEKYELFPLENEGLVHEYREWAGLPLLEDYAANWDIELNIKKLERDFAYADSLVKAELSAESKFPYFHGQDFSGKTKNINPNNKNFAVPVDAKCILGAKSDCCLTMPKGTEVIVMFTDNQIVDYPDQDDIFIKEYGGANDKAAIYVSYDGKKFDSLGITFDGRASSLDLAQIQYPHPVKFVKVVSLDNNGALPGYDLVYIKGLPGSNIDAKMNAKQIQSYLVNAQREVDKIAGMKAFTRARKEQSTTEAPFVLKDVHFNSRSAVILKQSIPYLDRLVVELNKTKWEQIILSGHTDNQGSEASNQRLSMNRAKAIKDYLWSKGISTRNIVCKGYGATRPLRPNNTGKGRAINRRVELQIVR